MRGPGDTEFRQQSGIRPLGERHHEGVAERALVKGEGAANDHARDQSLGRFENQRTAAEHSVA